MKIILVLFLAIIPVLWYFSDFRPQPIRRVKGELNIILPKNSELQVEILGKSNPDRGEVDIIQVWIPKDEINNFRKILEGKELSKVNENDYNIMYELFNSENRLDKKKVELDINPKDGIFKIINKSGRYFKLSTVNFIYFNTENGLLTFLSYNS
ncbi:hypothetical protein SAMN02745245_01810 [Anaerosphaera aminiphila DSM 21120]|uniref:Uncharacterized protein n=1 Tax=Anaerosphaera aminiphila DSM 21120 TaxID=1120995 RepID=A0A1M5UM60_9FIRM|nr:hypothetical protein [Anaerosphaera aminiphila]SHH64102.1 hypothetical protein SAMN02745245_01810 [Anaerosphaera aminiphila DSM 21120]